MTRLNNNTEKAQAIIREFHFFVTLENGATNIFTAYDRPSRTKVDTFDEIEKRARATEGYNHDLRVVGHNCFHYSTLYSFTDEEGRHIVKDTYANTFEVVVEE